MIDKHHNSPGPPLLGLGVWNPRQAEKAKALGLNDLHLPNETATFLALSGRYPELLSALEIVAFNHPDEFPLDAGAARCRVLESRFYDAYAESYGRPRGSRALEAVWLATDLALYFVAPNVGQYLRWSWAETMLHPIKRGRKLSKVRIDNGGDSFEIRVGSKAMSNLLAVQSWVRT